MGKSRKKMKKWVSVDDGGRKRVPVSQNATKGVSLAKAMRTMQEKYGVTFLFCKPEEAGAKNLRIINCKEVEQWLDPKR